MKTSVISFSSFNSGGETRRVSEIANLFINYGFRIHSAVTLSVGDDAGFLRNLKSLRDFSENVVILDNGELTFDLKSLICDFLSTQLEENGGAKEAIDAFNAENGTDYGYDYALMPLDSVIMPNDADVLQGFITEDGDFTVSVIPCSKNEETAVCEKYLIPYFSNKYGTSEYNRAFKLVNPFAGNMRGFLDELQRNSDGVFSYGLSENNADVTLRVFFKPECSKQQADAALREIASRYKDYIYCEKDASLTERLFDLLELKNKTIAVAESFTGGNVTKELVSMPGISAYLKEGIVSYSDESKSRRLNVKRETLEKFGAVSKETAYEMAAGLLREKSAGFALATTGIAGPDSDGTSKPVGLCYVAVGSAQGVHVHKYLLEGDREKITQTGKNIALFLAFRYLKNI